MEAQVKGMNSFDPDQILSKTMEQQVQMNQMMRNEQFPIGNSIDPDFYRLGPDDILSIQVIPTIPSEQYISVSPENLIIIPRYGSVNVKGKTLTELRGILLEKIGETLPNASISITLKQARMVMVSITGNVKQPGIYNLPATYNIESALKVANKTRTNSSTSTLQAPAILKIYEDQIEKNKIYSESGIAQDDEFSTRNILLRRADGSSIVADLEKARAYNDESINPYILEGDEIFVPYNDREFSTISINGSVIRPSSLVFKEGDRASLLLKVSGGLKADADIKKVQLYNPGNSVLQLKVDENLNIIGDDPELLPGSVIIVGIRKTEPITNAAVVSIKGNVVNPGVYPIEHGKTKLKEFINIAGGFTADAYLPLAHIFRKNDVDLSPANARLHVLKNFQYSNLTLDDTTRYIMDVNLKMPYVSCDFNALFNENNNNHNVRLQNGDIIVIPSNPGRVYVYGQVNNPGFVEFAEGQSKEWYVEKAGGFAPEAVDDRTRIIRGNTRVWIEEGIVFAGDEIYVPREPDVPSNVQAQNYSIIASAALAAVSIISMIVNIVRTN